MINMRAVEEGTFSMPSGDSSAAAVFCCIVAYELDMPWIYLVLPLVMMGRVYYHCHWVGDTVAGILVGTFWGILFISYFDLLVPIFSWVCGENVFVPNLKEP